MPAAKAAKTQIGLRIGDGLRIGARTSRRVLPPARRISALEARRLAPALAETGLRGALLSWDGQLEDDARLVVAVARTAAAHGARILTYAGVTGVRDDGVDALDGVTGAAFSVRARRVILATGVWAGELSPAVALRPSRGSHLLDPRRAARRPARGGQRAGAGRARALGVRAAARRRPRGDRAHRRRGRRAGPRRARAERARRRRSCSRTRAPRSRSRSARRTSAGATPGCGPCWPAMRIPPTRPPTSRAATRSARTRRRAR